MAHRPHHRSSNAMAEPTACRATTGRPGLTALAAALGLWAAMTLAPTGAAAGQELQRRLQSTIIPVVELKDATVDDVVAYLRRQSAALDRDGRPLNFLLVLPPERNREIRARTVTMSLNRIPLLDVIRYFCLAAGLHFRLEDEAVILTDAPSAAPGTMESRAYPLAPGVLDAKPTRDRPGE